MVVDNYYFPQVMRGAYYVATAFFIASSTCTAAESVQIKSVKTQLHDKSQAGGFDTTTLPRRSLKGSGETPVAEEERVNFAQVIEKAENTASNTSLKLKKTKKQRWRSLKNILMPEKHVGTSANSSGERIRILQKNHEDAIAELKQVNKKLLVAIEEIEDIKHKTTRAFQYYDFHDDLVQYHFEQADAAAKKVLESSSKMKDIEHEWRNALEAAEAATTSLLTQAKLNEQLAIPAFKTGDEEKYQINEAPQADRENAINKAKQDVITAEKYEQKFLDLADSFKKKFATAQEDLKSRLKFAENYRYAVSGAMQSNENEIPQAEEAVSSAQANQNAQVAEFIPSNQELEIARAGGNPQLNLNLRAILSEKPTYATQDLLAAHARHAAPPAHFDTDSHVRAGLDFEPTPES